MSPRVVSLRELNLLATLGTALGDAVSDAVTAATGLSGAAPAGLATLWAEPGLSMDAFARIVGVTGSGGVRLVDRLTASGLVERRAGRDARAVSLWLTPDGEQAAKHVLAARAAVVRPVTEALDERERSALLATVEKVLAAITESRGHADHLCRLCDVAACPQTRCPVECAVPAST
jgi:MarR family transcriptional regulator, negative regulator of the multidrug operon emrRAB